MRRDTDMFMLIGQGVMYVAGEERRRMCCRAWPLIHGSYIHTLVFEMRSS